MQNFLYVAHRCMGEAALGALEEETHNLVALKLALRKTKPVK
jgi:hypothetical protein